MPYLKILISGEQSWVILLQCLNRASNNDGLKIEMTQDLWTVHMRQGLSIMTRLAVTGHIKSEVRYMDCCAMRESVALELATKPSLYKHVWKHKIFVHRTAYNFLSSGDEEINTNVDRLIVTRQYAISVLFGNTNEHYLSLLLSNQQNCSGLPRKIFSMNARRATVHVATRCIFSGNHMQDVSLLPVGRRYSAACGGCSLQDQ